MLSTGNGVNGFTLDPSLGEFILTHPNIEVYVIVKFLYEVIMIFTWEILNILCCNEA